MGREQVIWRRPTPDERRQQVSDDLRRTIGFLTAKPRPSTWACPSRPTLLRSSTACTPGRPNSVAPPVDDDGLGIEALAPAHRQDVDVVDMIGQDRLLLVQVQRLHSDHNSSRVAPAAVAVGH